MTPTDPRKLQAIGQLAAFMALRLEPGEQFQLALILLHQVSNLRATKPDGTEVPLPPEFTRLKDAAAEAHRAAERVLTSGLVTAPASVISGSS